jgi:WD40 repeat protein
MRQRATTDRQPLTAPDLFVSYATEDEGWVEGFLLDALKRAGVRYRTERDFGPGRPKLLEMQQAIQSALRTVIVLSPSYFSKGMHEFTNVLAQSLGAESGTWPVIPILRSRVELPHRFQQLVILDATREESWPAVVNSLCQEIHHRPRPDTAKPPGCPYPGMKPFTGEQHHMFFGRDAEIQHAIRRLRKHPFLCVIGPSGTGKSSLVLAGIVPALRQTGLFGPGGWATRVMRPGGNPLSKLAATFGGSLASPAEAIGNAIADSEGATRLLLVIDQFEELFALAPDHAEPFTMELRRLMQVPSCHVILTVRADYYEELMRPPYWGMVEPHRLEVATLDPARLRDAIVNPARTVDVHIDSLLVERLLSHAAAEPGALPLVQEAMVLLWEHLQGRYLSLTSYETLGEGSQNGLQVALARHADATYADLTLRQQQIAARVFLRLIHPGQGRPDTRCQQSMAQLRVSGEGEDLLASTLNRLVEARLLTVASSPAADSGALEEHYDLCHEALIIGWPALNQWVTERRTAEQVRRRLEDKAEEWVRLGGGEVALLDQVELLEAERWVSEHPDNVHRNLHRLIEASRGAVAAARSALEKAQNVELRHAEALAEEQHRARLQAISHRLAAEAFRQHEQHHEDELALLLAAQAYRFHQRVPSGGLQEIDETLRLLLAARHFSATFRAPRRPVSAVCSPNVPLVVISCPDRIFAWDFRESHSAPFVLGGSMGLAPSGVNGTAGHRRTGAFTAGIAFTPDGRFFVAGGDVGLHVWRTEDLRAPPCHSDEGRALSTIAISGGLRAIAAATLRTILIWTLPPSGLPREPAPPGKLRVGRSLKHLLFSPNDQGLAGAGDRFLLWWNPSDPARQVRTHDVDDTLVRLGFSPDSTFLLAMGRRSVRLYNVASLGEGQLEPTQFLADGPFRRSFAFSPDGRQLAVSVEDELYVFDLPELGESVKLPSTSGRSLTRLRFSPDSRLLAAGASDGTTYVWDLRAIGTRGLHLDQDMFTLRGHRGAIRGVEFTHDGTALVTYDDGDCVKLWDLHADKLDPRLLSDDASGAIASNGHNSLAVILRHRSGSPKTSPREGTALPGGRPRRTEGGTVAIWSLSSPQAEPRELRPKVVPQVIPHLRWLAISRDAQLAAAASPGWVFLWDVRENRKGKRVRAIDQTHFRKVLQELQKHFWDAEANQLPLSPHDLAEYDRIAATHSGPLAFTPDCSTLASASAERLFLYRLSSRVYDLSFPLSTFRELDTGACIRDVCYSGTGQHMAILTTEGNARLYKIGGEDHYECLSQLDRPCVALALSETGHRLGVATADSVTAYEITSTGLTHPPAFTRLASYTQGITLSPDGQTLASWAGRKVLLWNLQSAQGPPLVLRHEAEVRGAAFCRGGQLLGTTSVDGKVLLWRTSTSALLDVAFQRVRRNLTPEEWSAFVGPDMSYERTYADLPEGEALRHRLSGEFAAM